MDRRQWFDWHSWAGFKLSILMTFVLVTGTLATISIDIDWATNSAIRAQHGQPDRLDWGGIYDAASAAFPGNQFFWISAPQEAWFNAELVGADNEGRMFRAYVDPVTFEVTGTGRWYNWQRFFRQTHRHLMLPTSIGIVIVGLLSIPLFVSLISSFYIYKRWWRGFFRWPRKGAANAPTKAVRRARTYWGAMHRLAGVWSLWFVFLIAVTGAWYLVEVSGGNAAYPSVPSVEEPAVEPLEGIRLNELLAEAERLYPTLEVKQITLRGWDEGKVLFQGQADAVLVRRRANHVVLNPADAAVVDIRRGEELSVHARISEAADPLHFGTFGGVITRWIWFVFGIFMSALSITGVFLYGLRITRGSVNATAAPSVAWRLSWSELGGGFRWGTLSLVVLALALTAVIFTANPAVVG
ncbi:MAG: PepSY-associated TM helix domain-containing protein [Pseudomonadota bacterium]